MNEAIGVEGSSIPVEATSAESQQETVISRLEAKLGAQPEAEELEASEKATPPEEDGPEEETPKSEESTEGDSDEDEIEGDEEEGEDETEESDEEEASDEESEEEEDQTVLTEEQLAEVLGFQNGDVQVDEDGNILFRTKTNGEEALVPAKDLVASYQLEKHNQQKSQKLSEEIRNFEVRRNEEEHKLGNAVSEATGLVMYLEQKILNDYAPQKLEALRTTNPAEWSAKRQELQENQAELIKVKQHLQNTINQKAQEQQAEQITKLNQYVDEQTELIRQKIPEWGKPDVFVKENEALQNFVTSTYGFSPEEYAATNDHRMFLLMRDAAKGRALSDTKVVKNKIKTLPKIVKPGTPQPGKKVRKAKQTEKKRLAVKKAGGNTESIAALLMDRI